MVHEIDDGDLDALAAALAKARPGDVVKFRGEIPSAPTRLRVGDLVAAGEERPVGVPPGGGKPMPLTDEMFVVRNVRPERFRRPAGVTVVQKAPRR